MANDTWDNVRNTVAVQGPAAETMPAVVDYGASPLDMPVTTFTGALKRRGDNRKALIEWVHNALVAGTDYGPIHVVKGCPKKNWCNDPSHFSKDSLRKPGAEKICGMLGVLVTFPAMAKYEENALNGVAIQSIILRCLLLSPDGSKVVSEGTGARNVAQDFGDLNKALKMCMKSAQIDATLRMAGLSEIFTQDLEDMPEAADQQQEQPRQQPAAGFSPPPSYSGDSQGSVFDTSPQQPLPGATPPPAQPEPSIYATLPQRDYVQNVAVQVGISSSMLYDKFKITSLAELPKDQVDAVLKWLRSYDIDDSAQIPNI